MMNKIPVKPLMSLTTRIFSGASIYSIAKLKESENGVPVLNIKDISEGQILKDKLKLFSLDNFENAERYMAYPGDVLITCRGTRLKSIVIPENINKILISANLIVIRPNEQILPSFLVAYFNTKDGQKAILSSATYITVFALNVSDVGKINVPVPPLSLQKEIINLANTTEEQYRLSLEIANIRKMIANQVITKMLAQY